MYKCCYCSLYKCVVRRARLWKSQLQESLGNLLRAPWEPAEGALGTCWGRLGNLLRAPWVAQNCITAPGATGSRNVNFRSKWSLVEAVVLDCSCGAWLQLWCLVTAVVLGYSCGAWLQLWCLTAAVVLDYSFQIADMDVLRPSHNRNQPTTAGN